jgi:hypothetical protein
MFVVRIGPCRYRKHRIISIPFSLPLHVLRRPSHPPIGDESSPLHMQESNHTADCDAGHGCSRPAVTDCMAIRHADGAVYWQYDNTDDPHVPITW